MQSILDDMRALKTDEERLSFLEQRYLCLFLFVLKGRGMKKALSLHMEKYKEMEHAHYFQYTRYVHGFWLPWLEE